MPLEKAAEGTPGFGRNIKREIAAGKPQKQAVAIAFSKAGERNDAEARSDDRRTSAQHEAAARRHVDEANTLAAKGDHRGAEEHRDAAMKLIAMSRESGGDGGGRGQSRDANGRFDADTYESKLDAAASRADALGKRLDSLERRDSAGRMD